MRLFTKCKNCKNEISFKSSCGTRVELAMKEGENKKLSCKECLLKEEYYINDIYAKKSKLIEVIITFLFLIGTPLIGYIVYKFFNFTVRVVRTGALMLIPIAVYSILKQRDRMRVNTFNREYL